MRYALLMICVFLTGAVFAQSDLHPLNYFTTKDGLSNNMVGCVRQDSRGFLWVATKEGLNRFDGFQFKKYFSERNNPGSLTHNNVLEILEYMPGHLLVATGNGLSVLNTVTGKFENEKIKSENLKPTMGNTINGLYKDKQANIWINHNGELDVLDSNLQYKYRFTDLSWAKNCKGALITFEDWQTDKNNRLWFLSDTSGINIIDLAQKKVFNAKFNPENIPYLQHDYIRSFLVDEQNNAIWYAPWGRGLFRYDLVKKTQQQILFGLPVQDDTRTINSIVKTEEGNILCFIAGKCYEVNGVTAQYKEISWPFAGNRDVIAATIILKTNDHQFWIGGTGLWLLGKKKETYKEVPLVTPGKTSTGESTDMFISSSGKLYCTYNNNLLVVMEENRNIFSSYTMQNKPNNIFTTVVGDGHDQIWVGSTNGLFLFNENNQSFSQPSSLPPELRYYNINVMYADNDGDLWIGSRNPFSLYHYIVQKNDFEQVTDKTIDRFASFGLNSRISNIVSDKSENLFMTSRVGGGILRYEKKNNTWKYYPPAGKNGEFLQKKGLLALYADDNGFLWFSNVYGDGLIRYDYKNDGITKFSRSDGLQSDYIQNVFGDKTGRLWVTTGYGITSVNTDPFHAESTISIPGILQADPPGILDHVQNSLVLSLPDRVLFIPTLADTINKVLPSPVLDKLTVNNQQLFFDPQNEKLVLDHEQKNITIDFTAVNLLHNNIRFAYKLSGVDKDWKYADIARSAQYSILAPGSYTFIIKSGNEKGDWSPEYELLSFTIHPPWWQTGWFRMLAVIFIISSIYFLLKIRIRQIKKEAGLKHKIAETEMMALRAQMNPHFIFNCINGIDALIQSNDKYNATVYLNKFAKLIRNILDSSKQNTVALTKDLETLQFYIDLEQFRHENKFTAEIKTDPSILEEDYKVPPLIIQPYVENAILHGLRNRTDNNGKLFVSVNRQNGYIQYIIEDNGVGRQATANGKSSEKQSYGMQMSKNRVQLFNNDEGDAVTITDKQNPTGTRVEVLLKMQ